MRRIFLLGLCGPLAVACASTPVPREEIARAKAAIQAAERDGAGSRAAGDLRMARDKLERAQAARGRSGNLEALRSAEQAEVDAQYAAAKARQERAKEARDEMQASFRALREEISR